MSDMRMTDSEITMRRSRCKVKTGEIEGHVQKNKRKMLSGWQTINVARRKNDWTKFLCIDTEKRQQRTEL